MTGLVDVARLGAVLPKTITLLPRSGNPPPRTVETCGGMLNSIGLDNDGIEAFVARQMPELVRLGPPIVVSIAGKTHAEFVEMAARLDAVPGVAAIELNMSCPNVSGGIDFATDPAVCQRVVAGVREGLLAADPGEADPQRNVRRRDRPGGRGRRGRRHLANKYLPGPGDRLAAAASAAGGRDGRPQRSGDQAHRPASGLPGGPSGEDAGRGDRRDRLCGRRDGVPRRRGDGLPGRHRHLLQPAGEH